MAFFGFPDLSEVLLPSTLTSIGYGAFQACPSLKEITIPSTVTSIESGALDQNITILCEEGSAAHRYAEESGINFVLTGEHKHSFGQWQVKEEPTCTEPGIEARTCSCGYEETRQIAPLDHDFSEEWTTDKEPTCTEEGERSRHCSRCDERTDIEKIEKLPHTYGEWITDTPATYYKEGKQHRICSRCNNSEEETIPVLQPDFESHPDYSLAEFTVVDALNPDTKISDAVITVTGPEGSWQAVTEELLFSYFS